MAAFPLITDADLARVTGRPGVVFLDFWQAGCPPCRALEPQLERFSRRHRGELTGYRIDVDAEQVAIATFRVMSIPTIVVLRDGGEVTRLDGLIRDADLDQVLRQACGGRGRRTPTGPAGGNADHHKPRRATASGNPGAIRRAMRAARPAGT